MIVVSKKYNPLIKMFCEKLTQDRVGAKKNLDGHEGAQATEE